MPLTESSPLTQLAPTLLGADRLVSSGLLQGLRAGVVCNPSSIDGSFRLLVDRLTSEGGARVGAIFGPQHGFRSDVQENMIETGHGCDRVRGVPIYSLYSETREPTREMLDGLDVLVIDLQDVGTRIYTYIYTMANCLRACQRVGIPVLVCDRPNPVGGVGVEGPMLQPAYSSFVGQFPIPMRHGMTIGELARLFNHHFGIGAKLDVMTMEGWDREMWFDETGLPWVMPSPNIPTLDSAVVYPGTVLFEGTNISEGRGTTRPFELLGAPWIDSDELADRMNAHSLAGAHFRPSIFEPTFHKHAKQPCGGCQIHVTDREAFEPVRAGVTLLHELRAMAPERFAWRDPPYEYEHDKLPIDILAGGDELRGQIERGVPPSEVADRWQPAVEEFLEVRERFLIY